MIRNDYRLSRAICDLRYLYWEIDNFYRKTRISAYAANKNRASRGCHYREDDPSNEQH